MRPLLILLLAAAAPACMAADAATAVQNAHDEIWRRFMDKHHVMLDFCTPDGSVSLPTPEECRLGKPNALGWWAPIENGAMFNGMYMDALVTRWRVTRDPAAAGKARRLMQGLLFLNSISDVPGFVGRGVSTDGRSHYPMGSNDQTFPWFHGLWLYWRSGIATEDEKSTILRHLVTTAEAIEALRWQMPAEPPFGVRGGFGGFSFEDAPRLLFLCKMMHQVTGQAKWDAHYRAHLHQSGGKGDTKTRLEWCAHGMRFDDGHPHSWTACNGVCALRSLWEMETDETLRARYHDGLLQSAATAMGSLKTAAQWDNADTSPFEHDWRVMNTQWRPQTTEHEAQALAQEQLRAYGKVSPRRGLETRLVREPVFAAWVVTLAPDRSLLRQRASEIEQVITAYDYTRLIYSQFFPVEAAWWRLQEAR
ncbi:MAG TPA: hypothetical protein PK490_08450 [Prosthecobacter sp.]|nr:hypothetical protein [Prosthecobacter sp.]HRK14309.1 hypothetical protein [Prosthecobacter sp.]